MEHTREATGPSAHGLLLGMDLDGTLEVSNSFPLPHHSNDDDDKSAKGVGECTISSYIISSRMKRNTGY